MTEKTELARVAGRPEIQCAAALGRGYWCRRRREHSGQHEPNTLTTRGAGGGR